MNFDATIRRLFDQRCNDRYEGPLCLSHDDEELPLWRRQPEPDTDLSPGTERYLSRVQKQKNEVKNFNTAVRKVINLHSLLLGALDSEPDIEAVREAINRLDLQFSEVDKQCSFISKSINELRDGMLTGCTSHTEAQVRKNQLMSLTDPFRSLLLRFNQDYVHYQEASRKKAVDYAKSHDIDEDGWICLLRQAPLAPEISQEDEPEVKDDIQHQRLRRSSSAFAAVFNEIKERSEMIGKVENQIEELANLYHQLQFHVMEGKEQAEIVDQKIEESSLFVNLAQNETEKVVAAQKFLKRRRKMVTKMRILTVVLIVLVIVLLVTLLKMFISMLLRVH